MRSVHFPSGCSNISGRFASPATWTRCRKAPCSSRTSRSLRVIAPLPQAQLVETRLINLVHFETVIASKAARMVLAADGKPLVDFGLRRAHGAEAGMLAARASYLAGFAGTATLAAGLEYGIPVRGTMAHSFIQAHDDEELAFEHFARSRPSNLVLLIDTYDTERAAERVVALAQRLAAEGIAVSGVRIDSGDLGEHARRVRRILDDGGLRSVAIVASGGLDEDELLSLRDAPIDSFGVGTSADDISDAPASSTVRTNSRNTQVSHGGSVRRARPPGPVASRSGDRRTQLVYFRATWFRWLTSGTAAKCC